MTKLNEAPIEVFLLFGKSGWCVPGVCINKNFIVNFKAPTRVASRR